MLRKRVAVEKEECLSPERRSEEARPSRLSRCSLSLALSQRGKKVKRDKKSPLSFFTISLTHPSLSTPSTRPRPPSPSTNRQPGLSRGHQSSSVMVSTTPDEEKSLVGVSLSPLFFGCFFVSRSRRGRGFFFFLVVVSLSSSSLTKKHRRLTRSFLFVSSFPFSAPLALRRRRLHRRFLRLRRSRSAALARVGERSAWEER